MRIYVGNLAYQVTEHELEAAFTPYGQVESAQVISDRMTGRSKGFGFVEMPNQTEAEAAISALNGKAIDGRTVTVNEARPREDRSRQGGFGQGRSSNRW